MSQANTCSANSTSENRYTSAAEQILRNDTICTDAEKRLFEKRGNVHSHQTYIKLVLNSFV